MNARRRLAFAACLLFVAAAPVHAQIQLVRSATFGDPSADDVFVDSAVSPNGDIAVVSQVGLFPAPTSTVVHVFSPLAVLRWSATMPQSSGSTLAGAGVGFDGQGDLRVLWSGDNTAGQPTSRISRFSAGGILAWTFEYTPVPYEPSSATALLVDAAGSSFVGGGVSQSALLFAIDAQGSKTWETRSSPPAGASESIQVLTRDSNGDFYGCGPARLTTGAIQYALAFVRIDASGNLVWRTMSSPIQPTSYYALPFDIEVSAGRVAVVGDQVALIYGPNIGRAWCLDANGQLLWERLLPNPGPGHSLFAGTGEFEADGNLRVTATTHDYFWINADSRSVLLRLDSNGHFVQSSTWGPLPAVLGAQGGDMLLGSAGEGWIGAGTYLQQCDADLHVLSTLRLVPDPQHAWLIKRVLHSPNGSLVAVGAVADVPWSYTHDLFVAVLDISDAPRGYCTAKTTSNGCEPMLTFTGLPSASASSGFVVRASSLRNHQSGLLFYGINGAQAAPFQGGTLCVQQPVARTAPQDSQGNALPANDCSGSFSIDMNAFAAGALGGSPLNSLQLVGTVAHCQFWGRDPGFAPQDAMLTSALHYTVLP